MTTEATIETTPTLEIKRDFDRKLQQIRNHPDYSADAKRRYIAEAYEKAQAEYREVIETGEQEIQERVENAEKAVFEAPYPRSATEEEKVTIRAARRAAYEGARSSALAPSEDPQHSTKQLERLLERAERTQDPELADAVYHVATEQGIRGVADAYLGRRPKAKRRWEEYVAARTEAESLERQLGIATSFGLMEPPELNSRAVVG